MKTLRILNVVALLAVLVVNGLAGTVAINGQTTGQVSDDIPSLFTPSGYVFSIWGLIYLGLTAYIVYQVWPSDQDRPFIARIGYWFVIGSVFNIIWLFVWQYERFLLSLFVMLGILASLIVTYLRLGIGRNAVSRREKWLVHLPFSIYLGWISVATIANVAVVLVTLGWDGFGIAPELWTAIMVVIAAVLGIVMAWRRKEIAYPLVIVWALMGIAFKQPGISTIVASTWISALAVLVGLGWSQLRLRKQ